MSGRSKVSSKPKYEELVRNAINTSLRRDFSDTRLTFVTVTRVELSDDYANAKVWWDTFDTQKRGDCVDAISAIKGRLRKLLASRLEVRHVPDFHFVYDSQYEDEQKIAELLKAEGEGEN